MGVRFFAGVPLISQGKKIGTLCIIDTKSRLDLTEKKLSILLEISSMISTLIDERNKRYLQVQREQIQYLIGITNNLKIPMSKITIHYHEMRRYYDKLKSILLFQPNLIDNYQNDYHIYYKRLSKCVYHLSEQVITMSHHLDMSLKLAYITSEAKRKVSYGGSGLEHLILNPYLNANKEKKQLVYGTLEQIVDYLQDQFYPYDFLAQNDYIRWNYDLLDHRKVAVDRDLLSLILHTILKPHNFYTSPNQSRHSSKKQHQYFNVHLSIDEARQEFISPASMSVKEPINGPSLVPTGSTSPSSILTGHNNNGDLHHLLVTIYPVCKGQRSPPKTGQKLIRQKTIREITPKNLVEFSEQSLLKDILRSSNGGMEVYQYPELEDKKDGESIESTFSASVDEFEDSLNGSPSSKLSSFIVPSPPSPPKMNTIYRLWCLCDLKEENKDIGPFFSSSDSLVITPSRLALEALHEEEDDALLNSPISTSNEIKMKNPIDNKMNWFVSLKQVPSFIFHNLASLSFSSSSSSIHCDSKGDYQPSSMKITKEKSIKEEEEHPTTHVDDF